MNRSALKNGIVHRNGAKRTANRLKDRRGFSLAETLLTVLIMLLVSVIVVSGMPAATNAFKKVIIGANAKTMLSTAITALHDELGTAWDVKHSDDKKSLTFFNAGTGANSSISLDATGAIQVQDYITLEDDLIHSAVGDTAPAQGTAYTLVSAPKSVLHAESDLCVTYESVEYADGIVSITGLKICKKRNPGAEEDEPVTVYTQFADKNGSPIPFKIRIISADDVEADGT